MNQEFPFADELGPSRVIHVYEPRIGLRGIVVVDNAAAGPAIGGLRIAPDVSAQECFRLARAMTLKNAAAGLPHGGGKSVIFADPKAPPEEKARLVRAFARLIGQVDDYIVGPDMGTNEECMAWIHDEIGRCVGLPAVLGGIPLDELGMTGFGLRSSIEVAAERIGLSLAGARVAVQGFGSVGRHAARFLQERGAVLVAASDSRGTLADPGGIDIDALARVKDGGGSVVDAATGERGDVDAIVDVECEVWIPAARPDVIRMANVDRLHTKLIAEGANIPIEPAAERVLHERGVVVLPDFIANAGGVICAAVEYRGGSAAEAFRLVDERIQTNTAVMLDEAARSGVPPRAAAETLAERRVREAMGYRTR
jgi:glutamate dehydrogenase (NAD(P)+)